MWATSELDALRFARLKRVKSLGFADAISSGSIRRYCLPSAYGTEGCTFEPCWVQFLDPSQRAAGDSLFYLIAAQVFTTSSRLVGGFAWRTSNVRNTIECSAFEKPKLLPRQQAVLESHRSILKLLLLQSNRTFPGFFHLTGMIHDPLY